MVSRLTTPTRISMASTTREVTNPMAAVALTRRVTGYSATAVATQATAVTISSQMPHRTGVASPALEEADGVVDDVREQPQLRDRRRERHQVGDAPREGDLARRAHPGRGTWGLLVSGVALGGRHHGDQRHTDVGEAAEWVRHER